MAVPTGAATALGRLAPTRSPPGSVQAAEPLFGRRSNDRAAKRVQNQGMATTELSRSFEEGIAGGRNATEHDRRVWQSIGARDLQELSDAVARDTSRRGVSFESAERQAGLSHRPDPARDRRARNGRCSRAAWPSACGRWSCSCATCTASGGSSRPAWCRPARSRAPSTMSRSCRGIGERIASWITVAGLDVVRDSDGSFKVLEDNLRTPSGIAYAVATREVMGGHLPPPRDCMCARSTARSRRSGRACAPRPRAPRRSSRRWCC